MRIVQITDSHVTAAGTLWQGRVDTAARLARALAAADALSPDLIVHSGDVVEAGAGPDGDAEYAAALPLLAAVAAPLMVLPGNHDDRAGMRRHLLDQPWRDDVFLVQKREIAGLTVIGFDTLADGRTAGEVCAARLDWLGAALGEGPALIFQHHPPCPMGLPFMDGFAFAGTEAYAAAIAGRDLRAIACGHVHVDALRPWAGTLVASAEATSVLIPPDAVVRGDRLDTRVVPLRLRLFDWAEGALTIKSIPVREVEG